MIHIRNTNKINELPPNPVDTPLPSFPPNSILQASSINIVSASLDSLYMNALWRQTYCYTTRLRWHIPDRYTVTDSQIKFTIWKSYLQKRPLREASYHIKRFIRMYFSFSPSPPCTSYTTSPMDIPTTSASRPQSPSCAFPSWPRRASLSSGSSCDERATSYISDDDLEDLFPCTFDEAEQDCTPSSSPAHRSINPPSAQEAQVVVDTGALMRELIAQEKAKRERKQRRRSGSPRKLRNGTKQMSAILESGEWTRELSRRHSLLLDIVSSPTPS